MSTRITCPKCLGNTFCIETRTRADEVIRRRRVCSKCGLRFTTYEDWRAGETETIPTPWDVLPEDDEPTLTADAWRRGIERVMAVEVTMCPGGCGCRLGTDDADARECGCEEGCCGE